MKYKLTKNTKRYDGKTLYQIEAIKDFWNVKKWDLWWWIEKENNLSQEWKARVYWNARVSWRYNYTQWRFIWWWDVDWFTEITKLTWTDYWKHQYVLWDYEITPQDDVQPQEPLEEIIINGKRYREIKE